MSAPASKPRPPQHPIGSYGSGEGQKIVEHILTAIVNAVRGDGEEETGRHKMVAKFPGTCLRCGGRIAIGDSIFWEKSRGTEHALECDPGGAGDYHGSIEEETGWCPGDS